VSHVAADFAFKPQRLFLRCFGKLALQRVLLSTVTSFFPCVGTLTLCHGSAFPSLVQRNRVILMLLAVRTVSPNFLGNVHGYRYQLSNRGTHAFLYLFRTTMKKRFLEALSKELSVHTGEQVFFVLFYALSFLGFGFHDVVYDLFERHCDEDRIFSGS
jgi:hypothetical protein